jgi:DNA-3-methyladenine glycosylase
MMPDMARTSQTLPSGFFDRPADRVARELIGSVLAVRGRDGRVTRHVVHETEAYLGAHDLACHGAKGMTRRNAVMFGPAGRWYVYLCYGLHWMLNVVTGAEGVPAAVLVRGAGRFTGPGRVTKGLGIDRGHDGRPATRAAGLWLEPGVTVPRRLIERTPRIGVGYAGDWAAEPLRFVVDPEKLPTISLPGHRPSRRHTR